MQQKVEKLQPILGLFWSILGPLKVHYMLNWKSAVSSSGFEDDDNVQNFFEVP